MYYIVSVCVYDDTTVNYESVNHKSNRRISIKFVLPRRGRCLTRSILTAENELLICTFHFGISHFNLLLFFFLFCVRRTGTVLSHHVFPFSGTCCRIIWKLRRKKKMGKMCHVWELVLEKKNPGNSVKSSNSISSHRFIELVSFVFVVCVCLSEREADDVNQSGYLWYTSYCDTI